MLVIGNDELGNDLGKTVKCKICGKTHKVEYGENVLKDGTKIPSKLLAFYKCGDSLYICGINGREI